jgi:outer membrane protein
MNRLSYLILIAAVLRLGAAEPRTLSLEEARQLAVQTHPKISAAELRALAAKEVVKEARSSYFPTIIANATAVGAAEDNTRITAGGLSNPSIFNRNGDGVSISQIITDFGRTANLSSSAKYRASAEAANAETVREQIILLIDSAYFDALKAESVLNVAQQTLGTRQLLLDQVSALASNKLKSELDVSFASVNVDEAKLIALQATNDLEAAETRLATLAGFPETAHFALRDDSNIAKPPDASELVVSALKDRPDLRQLRLENQAAFRFAKAERALRYPTLSAIAAAGVTPVHDGEFNDEYAVAGVNLSIPLFAGGLYSAKSREAQLRAEAAGQLVKDREDEVIRDVRIAALGANTAYERISLTERMYQHAAQAYGLAEAKYKAGGSSIVELSQAQLNKTSAEIARATARYNYQVQLSILNFQSGRFAGPGRNGT